MRPMLAAKVDLKKVNYPCYTSPKLDGVRALVIDGVVYSRSMKRIPNRHVQSLAEEWPSGLDGELIIGDPTAPDCYRKTVSGVMRHGGEPSVTFWVFDRHDMLTVKFDLRYALLCNSMDLGCPGVTILSQTLCENEVDLTSTEVRWVQMGYEGLIIRDPNGLYKYGRSTVNEGGMLKMKRFLDGEAHLLGMEELMHNGNESFINELGQTAHTHHQENKVGMGSMGALLVKDLETGVEFKIGTGFSQVQRDAFWSMDLSVETPLIIKYQYFPLGSKDKPRHPSYLGIRDEKDMDSKVFNERTLVQKGNDAKEAKNL